jgi:branched-chain amino acid transport system ATP-binding protein
MNLLREVGLEDLAGEMSSSLPYGKQRRLEIARALATGPKLLLLDEPAAGMNPIETQALLDLILRLRKDYDLTVFLIEHDMKFVMQICERIKVLDYGVTIAEGTPYEIQNNPRVIEAYLGEVKSVA